MGNKTQRNEAKGGTENEEKPEKTSVTTKSRIFLLSLQDVYFPLPLSVEPFVCQSNIFNWLK